MVLIAASPVNLLPCLSGEDPCQSRFFCGLIPSSVRVADDGGGIRDLDRDLWRGSGRLLAGKGLSLLPFLELFDSSRNNIPRIALLVLKGELVSV